MREQYRVRAPEKIRESEKAILYGRTWVPKSAIINEQKEVKKEIKKEYPYILTLKFMPQDNQDLINILF